MEIKNSTSQKPEPIFPEKSDLIIEKILKDYGLKEIQKEEMEKVFKSKDFQERIRLFKSLPSANLARLAREYAEGKISLHKIPLEITERLNVPEAKAKKIFQDLEKSLLSLITPQTEKKFKTPGEILLGEKPVE